MRCRIHRGCHEIGGNCVEVESQGKRIILDIGLPLKVETAATVPNNAVQNNTGLSNALPNISGLTSADDSLLGILISHPHPDHYGLLERISEPVPVFMGEAARKIIEVSQFFTPLPSLGKVKPLAYSDRVPLRAGPFTITPLAIDHSAHDSYCLLVAADGKRLLYSGDLRAHGRKAQLFQRLVDDPPQDIDVLICEGTQIGRDPDFTYKDEHAVAVKMTELFRSTTGMCLVWCSSQNIDRMSSVFQATKESGRQLILDLYTAEIMRATGDNSMPIPGRNGVKVYLPLSQKALIKREKAFHIANRYYPQRIYPEALAEAAPGSVTVFRPKMWNELQRAGCLDSGLLVTSLWSGTVKKEMDCIRAMKAAGIAYDHVHTSGHATREELKQFIAAFPKSRIVPIHLEDREGFGPLSPNVEPRNDHEWWEV
jgi:ribonuclease J